MGLVPYKERTESVLSLPPVLGCGEKVTACEERPPQEELAANLILGFQSSWRALNK